MAPDILEIDGTVGEGGGQVLRTALGLSVVTRRPVRVVDIRAGRRNPGLAPQHLAGVRALARLSGGEAEGLAVGSTEVRFAPGDSLKTELEVEVGTAGSVTLVLQGLLIALAGSGGKRVRIRVRGGTDVAWSPPFLYLTEVLFPLLGKMGFELKGELKRAGFYPRGGGEVEVAARPPDSLSPLVLEERGEPGGILAFPLAGEGLERKRVAERMLQGIRDIFPQAGGRPLYPGSFGPGASALAVGVFARTFLGGSCLGERGLPAEELGRRAAADLKAQLMSGATVDLHASDQLLPFLALASGPSVLLAPSLSSHAKTNMEVVTRFLPVEFKVQPAGKGTRIVCLPAPPSP